MTINICWSFFRESRYAELVHDLRIALARREDRDANTRSRTEKLAFMNATQWRSISRAPVKHKQDEIVSEMETFLL